MVISSPITQQSSHLLQLQKGKVFLLDDDELILSMLSRVLKKEGYEVYLQCWPSNLITKKHISQPVIIKDPNKGWEHVGELSMDICLGYFE